MSDYVKSTDFASKDTLPSGDSAKIVRGTEIDAEFEALEVAIASKANTSDVSSTYAPLNSPTFTGSPVLPTGTTAVTQAAGDNDTSVATTAFVTTAVAAIGYPSFKNRIINGAMMIDQRNAGASVTPTNQAYVLDRWKNELTQSSKFSVQQSTTAPAGFKNSMLITSLSAYSVISTDQFNIGQYIEGFNVSDLGWGTANAQSVTLSFWVRSSLTGTFGGSLTNGAANRSYPFSYTINAANTWEQKTVSITGDTSGTWPTDNTASIRTIFSLGCGSTLSGTAGTWAGTNYFTTTGATSVVGTSGATFYITGVQLEKGSTATSFDYRPYGTELSLCQRYFYNNISNQSGTYQDSSTVVIYVKNPVPMRTAPSITSTTLTLDVVNLGNPTFTPAAVNTDVTGLRLSGVASSTSSTGIHAGISYSSARLPISAEL